MALTRWRPTGGDVKRVERDFMHELNRYFNDMQSWWEGAGELGAWSPDVNVFEKDDQIVVEAEMPGMKKDDIDVSVQDHVLTLSGERKEETETKDKHFYRRERVEGAFMRAINLPTNVDSEKIDAKYKNGLLTLTIPKAEEAKTKRVEIH
jgi:HSP20 family protein